MGWLVAIINLLGMGGGGIILPKRVIVYTNPTLTGATCADQTLAGVTYAATSLDGVTFSSPSLLG